MFKNLSIAQKIHIPLVASIVLGMLIVVGVAYFSIDKIKHETFAETKSSIDIYLKNELDTKYNVAIASAITIASNGYIKEALLHNDRERAINEVGKISQTFKESTEFKNAKVHIVTKDKKSFLRNWQLDRFGDDLSDRIGINEVFKVKKAIVGSEIDKSGLLSIRGIAPIIKEEELIGAVEFLLEYNSIVLKAKEQKSASVLYLTDSKASSFQPKDAKKLGNYYITQRENTIDKDFLASISEEDVLKALKDGYVVTSKYFISATPISDIVGKNSGVVVAGLPIKLVENVIDHAREGQVTQVILMAIVDIVIILLLIVVLNISIKRPINSFISKIKELESRLYAEKIVLDDTNKCKIDSKDEIGQIAKTFNLFVEKLRDLLEKLEDEMEESKALSEQAKVASEEGIALLNITEVLSKSVETGINEVQKGFEEVISQLSSVNNENKIAADVIVEVIKNTQNINDSLHKIIDMINETRHSSTDLSNSVDSISSVISLIKDISDQTNLLALNAAIEAARAGEHGRGFAVVADEVRKLAERTQKATQEVESIINLLKQNASSILEKAEVMEKLSANSASELESFTDSIHKTEEVSKKIKIANEQIADEVFANLVKLDHISFKANGYAAVFTKNLQAQLTDHLSCRFGKWYQTEGKEIFGKSPYYAQIEAPHKAVHDNIFAVLEIMKQGDILKHTKEILEKFNATEEASKQLFELLNKMVRENRNIK